MKAAIEAAFGFIYTATIFTRTILSAMTFELVADFIKHYFTANRYGIHSPFVSRLVNDIIYDFSKQDEYAPIERARQDLLKDNRVLNISDWGAGSALNNKKQKKVSEVAKNALKSPKHAQLIYRLAKASGKGNIIELGTSLGITSSYLSKARPKSTIISIEGCDNTAGVAKEVFQRTNCNNIDLRVGNFNDLLPPIVSGNNNVDFVFIDGNHRKDATLNYFQWCLPKLNEDSLIIFDDIYWSGGMKEAWQQIKAHPQVTLTIDIFQLGLVFFRKEEVKKHIKLRF